jgi:hypothetical protein
MTGMELSEKYYLEIGRPSIFELFPDEYNKFAVGLVGEGSICYGYDDLFSRDHDWGAAFCVWLPQEVYRRIGYELKQVYRDLPSRYMGHPVLKLDGPPLHRVGVFEIQEFYQRFTGLDHMPRSNRDWFYIPETYLSVATNGRVFHDSLGEFSRYREHLLGFYPEDIRLKKIASRCMTIGQAGQYNFERALNRGETVAAMAAKSEFIQAAISMVYLLNKRYMPFYKWMHRGLKDLPQGGEEIFHAVQAISSSTDKKDIPVIEAICESLLGEMRRQKLTDSHDDFLCNHGSIVQSRISDLDIQSIQVMGV